MAIPAILQGDNSGEVTITLAQGHCYEGATLVVVFNGVSRQYTNLTAGGSVVLAFTADETAGMPLGTALVNMRLVGANGAVETVGNADARIKVTDCVAEVNAGGSFAVTPGGNPLDGVEGLGTRYTGDQLRAKINEVIAKLGGTVAALLLCAMPCLGGVTVQTAPLGGIYSDEPVVTNVIVDVSDKADKADTYTKAEVDARIIELAPTPGDYETVSNRAMSARGKTDLEVYAAVTTPWTCSEVSASGDYSTMTNKSLWTFTTWEAGGEIYPTISYNGVVIGDCNSPMPDEDMPTASFWSMLYDENLYVYFSRHIAGMATGNRLATTNDIPDVSGYTTPADVTAAIREQSLGGIYDSELGVWWTPIMQNGALRYETNAVQNAADALAAASNVVASGGLASVDAVDAKISTNNAAFVEAVTNCPVVIASGGVGGDGFPAGDWSDYGTLGALLAAIIAAITWLKNNQRYALHTVTLTNGAGTLLDRAGNLVVVSGDTTLTLPALEHAGRLRDFLVRLEISGSTVPTITFQGQGSEAPNGADEITYETDGDEFPVPDEAGDWLYSFTESCVAHTFAVSLKKVNTVAAPQAQGGS